jgi:hypothetical protein
VFLEEQLRKLVANDELKSCVWVNLKTNTVATMGSVVVVGDGRDQVMFYVSDDNQVCLYSSLGGRSADEVARIARVMARLQSLLTWS